jgi:heat-inducible transcriptional repressor
VGSRTLAQSNCEGLSAATIRNVMAELAAAGLIEQPHTSAGRVPSVDGFRYYVHRLTGSKALTRNDEQVIGESFRGTTDIGDFLERTSHVLSLLSQGVGVAMATGGTRNALEHVHFQRMSGQRILVVVVTSGALVRDRVVRVGGELSQSDLDLAANYINANFTGWSLEDAQRELESRIARERDEYNRLHRSLDELARSGALQTEETGQLFMEGTANLAAHEQDSQRLRALLRALEEKQRIVDLLSAYLGAPQENVRVVVGLEEAMPDLSHFVLIGAPVRAGQEVVGSLAVIGPTRMDYQHTMSAVGYISRLFDRFLNDTDSIEL